MSKKNYRYRPKESAEFAALVVARQQELLTREEFLDYAVEDARRLRPKDVIEADHENFALLVNENPISMQSAYDSYRLVDPELREKALSMPGKAAADACDPDIPMRFDEAEDRLYPVLTSRDELAIGELGTNRRIPFSTVCDGLCVSLRVDSPATMMAVEDSLLSAWGVSFDKALESARNNLRSTNRNLWDRNRSGLYMCQSQGDYTSAMLMDPGLFEEVDVNGEVIVLPLLRGLVLAAGSKDDDALEEMISTASSLADHPRLVSMAPLRRTESGWARCERYDSDTRFAALKTLEDAVQARRVSHQGEILAQQGWVAAPLVPAAVGAVMGPEGWFTLPFPDRKDIREAHEDSVLKTVLAGVPDRETGLTLYQAAMARIRMEQKYPSSAPSTWCTWVDGIEKLLLPKTEMVFFVRVRNEKIIVQGGPWDDVQQHFGKLLRRTSMVPERYEVLGFPSEDEFSAIAQDCGSADRTLRRPPANNDGNAHQIHESS